MVHIRTDEGEAVEVHLPHWLSSDDFTERQREAQLRSHLIIKALAVYGPQNIYRIQKTIMRVDHKRIPYPRLLEYVAKLEARNLIQKVKGPAPRNARVFGVSNGMIGYLYFQHFLKREEVVQLLERHLPWLAFFRSFMPQEVDELIERQLSMDLVSELATRVYRPGRRVADLTPRDFEDARGHLEQTYLRDLGIDLLLSVMTRVSEDRKLSMKLKREARFHPEATAWLLLLSSLLVGIKRTLMEQMRQNESIVRLISGLGVESAKLGQAKIPGLRGVKKEEFIRTLRTLERGMPVETRGS